MPSETLKDGEWVSNKINYILGQPVEAVELPSTDWGEPELDSPQAIEIMALEDVGPEQKLDPDFCHIYNWLESETLPDDAALGKKTLLQSEQFVLSNGTLLHLYQQRARNLNKIQPVIQQLAVPSKHRHDLLQGVHQTPP